MFFDGRSYLTIQQSVGMLSWNSFHPQRPVLYWRNPVIHVKCQVSGVCFFARALTKIPSPLAAVALKCTVLPRCFSGSKYCPPLSEDRKKMCTVPQCLQIRPLDLTTCAFILMPYLFFCVAGRWGARAPDKGKCRQWIWWRVLVVMIELVVSRGYSASFLLLMSNCTIDWMEHGHRLSVKAFIWTVISR